MLNSCVETYDFCSPRYKPNPVNTRYCKNILEISFWTFCKYCGLYCGNIVNVWQGRPPHSCVIVFTCFLHVFSILPVYFQYILHVWFRRCQTLTICPQYFHYIFKLVQNDIFSIFSQYELLLGFGLYPRIREL